MTVKINYVFCLNFNIQEENQVTIVWCRQRHDLQQFADQILVAQKIALVLSTSLIDESLIADFRCLKTAMVNIFIPNIICIDCSVLCLI